MRSAGENPALRPWRTPANPAAQNSDAPTPQMMPTAGELKRLVESKRPPPSTPLPDYEDIAVPHKTAIGTYRTIRPHPPSSAFGVIADKYGATRGALLRSLPRCYFAAVV